MYRANLKPFTGEDIEIRHREFAPLYRAVVSEARAAGCNLSYPKFVRITADHDRNCGYSIGNVGGHIVVGRWDKGIEIGSKRRV